MPPDARSRTADRRPRPPVNALGRRRRGRGGRRSTPSEAAGRLSRRAFLTGAATRPGRPVAGRGPGRRGAPRAARRGFHRARPRGRTRGRLRPAAGRALADQAGLGSRPFGPAGVRPHGWNYLDGGISHSTPWHYTQDVPMLWYGPGIIPARVPEQVRHLGRHRAHGRQADQVPLRRAGRVADGRGDQGRRTAKPKLVVVLVWDAGGRYVLDLHPNPWPRPQGAHPEGHVVRRTPRWAPTRRTPRPIHATIGTARSRPPTAWWTTRSGSRTAGCRTPGRAGRACSGADARRRVRQGQGLEGPNRACSGRCPGTSAWSGRARPVPGGVKHIAVLRDRAAPPVGRGAGGTIPTDLARTTGFRRT